MVQWELSDEGVLLLSGAAMAACAHLCRTQDHS